MTVTKQENYDERLETLSMGSVNRSFDPYSDIDWDSSELGPEKNPELWILTPETDVLATSEWYLSLPEEKKIEIGRWRQANIAKVGSQFESILVRGLNQYSFALRNQNPEYRYTLHEAKEECNHQLMFQEMVNRIGIDVPGMPRWARVISPVVPLAATLTPVVFFFGVLGGEEPIDHIQKAVLRVDHDKIHPMMAAVMQLHVAEEARHIGFAHEYVKNKVAKAGAARKFVLSLALPVTMRVLHDLIVIPPKDFQREFDIPQDVFDESFKRGSRVEKARQGVFGDIRMLAEQAGLRNPVANRLWKALGIEGRVSRYRSEPSYEVA